MGTWLTVDKTFWLAGAGCVAVIVGACFPSGRLARSYAFSLATLLFVTGLISLATPTCELGWYALAIIPGALIGQHALYLGQIKNPFRSEGRKLANIDEDFLPNNIENGLSQARRNSERDFGWVTLSFRFGVPAVAIALIVGLFAEPLYQQESPHWMWSKAFVNGARYGGAGAYVYVLIYLSRRNFRHDITSGAAVWAAVELLAGPLLGGVAALLWQAQDGPSPASTTGVPFSHAVVFFSAGLAPRHMASALEEAAKRLMRSPDDKARQAPPRTKPLTTLRGITPSMADRLEEEGIEDVHGMAMADPMRLMRNTSFDQRQIVAWIDEAILMATLPDRWEKLEAQGVTGAIDLAWYCDAAIETAGAKDGKTSGLSADRPGQDSSHGSALPTGPSPEFAKLATLAEIDPSILWSISERFYWDGQVQLIWVLYQIGAEGVQTGEQDDPTSAEPASTARAA